jgi:hypothetical protein
VLSRNLEHDARGGEVGGAREKGDEQPRPSRSSGCGTISRLTPDAMIAMAATTINVPSTPLEKYSALSCP